MFIFYKHMKFRIQARLCLAVYDFEVHIMLNFSRYQTNGKRKIKLQCGCKVWIYF